MSNVETDIITEIRVFNNVSVKEYTSADRDLVEKFRMLAAREGNEALASNKYDPDTVNGQTWMTFVENELASISVIERSHYTGDPTIAGRICRYHILKKFRHSNAGFRMLPNQVQWAKDNGLKVLYWTHNVDNKALNALYQHKKTMPFRGESVPYFMTETYKAFKLQPDMIFRVSPKGDFLQYVYANILEDGYRWRPQADTIVYYVHNGTIDNSVRAAVL
jgi:glycerophosphoryl diester phosphodiesterase